jgi:hypothetical protein
VYSVNNEEITQLRTLLQNGGIDDTTYTDEQLGQLIQQAVTLIGEDYVTGTSEVEYDYQFNGDMYMTMTYPVIPDEVMVKLDGVALPEEDILHITSEGVIKFKRKLSGLLEVSYINGLSVDVMSGYLLLATSQLLKSNPVTGGSIGSITEGDVSVSYDNTGNTMNTLDSVITTIHSMFGARVKKI